MGTRERAKTSWQLAAHNCERDLASLAGETTIFGRFAAEKLEHLQVELEPLSCRYDVVVANPPYMGAKNMNKWLSAWVKKHYTDVKGDLFSCFMVRNSGMGSDHAQIGFMTPYVWMFIGTYEKLRRFVIEQNTITSLIQLEYSGFAGATVPICTFTLQKGKVKGYKGGYIRLSDFPGTDQQAPRALEALAYPDCGWFYRADAGNFITIPGSPIDYWASESVYAQFANESTISNHIDARVGLITGNGDRFLRRWNEVDRSRIAFHLKNGEESTEKWIPYSKGGDFRLWYGNIEYVVNWENDGWEMKNDNFDGDRVRAHNFNGRQAFKEGITWNSISSSRFHCRYLPPGFLFDAAGPLCEVLDKKDLEYILGLFSSTVFTYYMGLMNPTMNFPPGYLGSIPYPSHEETLSQIIKQKVAANIKMSKCDWDSFESSWDFKRHPLV